MERKKITLETLDAFMEENHKLIHPSTYEALASALGLPVDKLKSANEKFEVLKRSYSTLSKKERMGLVEAINNKDRIAKKENTYDCSCGC